MTPNRTTLTLGLLVAALLGASILLSSQGLGSSAVEALGSTTTGIDRPTDPADPAAPAGSSQPSDGPATGLDPGLEAAFAQAQAAAGDAGHDLFINSGFRTPERQLELLDEAVAKYGSFEEANRWVFTPERSMHVQGLAIDVGDGAGADWLEDNGARFGLCKTLDWEWWHFEWRAAWQESGTCPRPALDPSEAPGR